ncbi:MAG: DUF3098 domain-containing protein [Flammeovirgaceae bacterium TMED290]|nr:MAG: DUF3098 domain-containing protein [Flammeovirgaceae bacterium TMED290]|tara:strand:+ start:2553 stop:2756 length:204 start_codon:yes stop_codon:yes gene_type:complete
MEKPKMPFNSKNYKLMIIGIIIILTGFVIMSVDGEEYGYGFLGLTLGPLVVLFGFIFQFFAIFHKGK